MTKLARRPLLGSLATAAAALTGRAARAQAPGNPFTLGVASGDPWPDSVVLWTRLAPAPLAEAGGMGAAPVEVRWEVAEDERMARVVAHGTATARPESAHSVHVEVGGLRPARHYHYRFRTGAHASPIGRTRTAPMPDASDAITFLVAGCQNWEHGHFTAWRHAAAEQEVDFVFHYGDYIYEYAAREVGSRANWGQVVRAHHGGECLTLEDYRARHAQYRTDADLQAAHAAHPFIVSYDDHEIENNWAQLISQRDGGRRFPVATPPEAFAARAAAAFQAWWEHTPLRAAARPQGTTLTAYRRLRFGSRVVLHVLDTRRFRDDQPCGDGNVPPCAEVERANAQMLGAAQEEWLRAGLQNGASWQVLAQQVFMAPRLFPRGTRSMDSWDGYPAARARLFEMLGSRPTVVLTGDTHRAWANNLHRREGAPPFAVEFAATSITSEGDGGEAIPIWPELSQLNPHLRFHHNRRGYTRHTATQNTLTADYMAVPFVSRPDAPIARAGAFLTEARRPGVVPA